MRNTAGCSKIATFHYAVFGDGATTPAPSIVSGPVSARTHSCRGRRRSLHRRLLGHRLLRRGVLAAQPPVQSPLHLRAQRQFTQVLALLGARHESLLLQTLAFQTMETHLPFLDLGHARIAIRQRRVGVDGALGDGERRSAAVGGEAG